MMGGRPAMSRWCVRAEFYEYLQKNDPQLLEWNGDEGLVEDEEHDDEDDEEEAQLRVRRCLHCGGGHDRLRGRPSGAPRCSSG